MMFGSSGLKKVAVVLFTSSEVNVGTMLMSGQIGRMVFIQVWYSAFGSDGSVATTVMIWSAEALNVNAIAKKAKNKHFPMFFMVVLLRLVKLRSRFRDFTE
jgi:hypothetical protein